MPRIHLVLGALSGFFGVAAGAFGAHLLKRRLTEDLLAAWNTGASYQMYHALALVAVGVLLSAGRPGANAQAALELAGWLFVAGTLLFSGSLYALALSGVRTFGALTPFGGLALLGGWLALAWAAWRGTGGSS